MIEIIIGSIGLLVGGGIAFITLYFRNSKKANDISLLIDLIFESLAP